MAYLPSTYLQQRGIKSAKNPPREDYHAPRKISSDFKMAAQVLDKHLQQHAVKTPPFSKFNLPREGRNPIGKSKEKNFSIYVHHFNTVSANVSQQSFRGQNELRHNLYDHELTFCSDHKYTGKQGSDTVSCNSRSSSSSRSVKEYDSRVHLRGDSLPPPHRDFHSKRDIGYKIKQNVLTNKATIDKLEESYWAKWKPNKIRDNNRKIIRKHEPQESYHQVKDANNQTIDDPDEINSLDDILETVQEDLSHDDQDAPPQYIPDAPKVLEVRDTINNGTSQEQHSAETGSSQTVPGNPPPAPPIPARMRVKTNKKPATLYTNKRTTEGVTLEAGVQTKHPEQADEKTPVTMLMQPEQHDSSTTSKTSKNSAETNNNPSSVDSDVKLLKHMDSLVIINKKQNNEKVRYQQPKCIKLYKNEETTVKSSFMKGGSYPLKSCLKKDKDKEKQVKGNIRLGRPGSPLVIQVQKSPSGNKAKKNDKKV